jgi:hypothetical protein
MRWLMLSILFSFYIGYHFGSGGTKTKTKFDDLWFSIKRQVYRLSYSVAFLFTNQFP